MTYYETQPDRIRYRVRLHQLADRRRTRGDQIFIAMRQRIALADLVRRTPGWTWEQRADATGGCPQFMARQWKRQQSADLRDADAADSARRIR